MEIKKTIIIIFLLIYSVAFTQSEKKEGKEFYPSGNLKAIGNIIDEKKTGEWKLYYEEGQLYAIGHFIDEKHSGLWKYYYKNGQNLAYGNYYDGLPIGEWKNYYNSGELSIISNYLLGKLTWEYKEYHENGKISSIGKFIAGNKTGEWKVYHENGQLKSIGKFFDGKQDGEIIEYHIDSEIFFKEVWNNGNLTEKIFYLNGKIYTVTNIKDGKKNGEYKFYRQNGQLKIIGNYTDDKKNREWKFYHQNGQLKEIGKYTDGKKTGEWKYYGEDGKLLKTIFESDEPETKLNDDSLEIISSDVYDDLFELVERENGKKFKTIFSSFTLALMEVKALDKKVYKDLLGLANANVRWIKKDTIINKTKGIAFTTIKLIEKPEQLFFDNTEQFCFYNKLINATSRLEAVEELKTKKFINTTRKVGTAIEEKWEKAGVPYQIRIQYEEGNKGGSIALIALSFLKKDKQ